MIDFNAVLLIQQTPNEQNSISASSLAEPRIFLLEGKRVTLGELVAEMYIRSCAWKKRLVQEAAYVH